MEHIAIVVLQGNLHLEKFVEYCCWIMSCIRREQASDKQQDWSEIEGYPIFRQTQLLIYCPVQSGLSCYSLTWPWRPNELIYWL